MTWKEKKTNNIETNPLECWYATKRLPSGIFGIYIVVPQFSANDKGVISGNEPDHYVLFESRAEEVDAREANDIQRMAFYDGMRLVSGKTFIRVFHSLDEAKARAELQFNVIDSISKGVN